MGSLDSKKSAYDEAGYGSGVLVIPGSEQGREAAHIIGRVTADEVKLCKERGGQVDITREAVRGRVVDEDASVSAG